MPQTYTQKEEEEEKERRKRRAIEKQFERGKEFGSGEVKITAPKIKTEESGALRQSYEASLKTTVQEKDIVIDEQGTVSKKYEAKQTLEVSRAERYASEKRRDDEWRRKDRERKKRVRMKVTSRESAEAQERVARKKRLLKDKKIVKERINKQKVEGPARAKEVAKLRKALNEKRNNINKEVAVLQKILLGPFKSKSNKGGKVKELVKSLDIMIKSLMRKKRA